MRALADRLTALRIVAEIREDRLAASALPIAGRPAVTIDVPVVISEATQEEFEDLERSWTGTLPEAIAAARGVNAPTA